MSDLGRTGVNVYRLVSIWEAQKYHWLTSYMYGNLSAVAIGRGPRWCLNIWKIFCSILKMATTGLLPVWVPMVHTSVHIWYIFVHKMDRSGGFLSNLVRPYCCCAWVSRSKRGRRYGSDSTQIRMHDVTCDGHWKLRYQETENTDIFKITGGLVT